MRSIILISPRSDEEKHIIDQWKDRSVYCRVVSEGRVTLKTEKGHLFIDFGGSENMYAEYEDEDLDLENSLTTEDWEYLTKIGNLIYEENNHKERIKVPEVLDEEIKAINNFYL